MRRIWIMLLVAITATLPQAAFAWEDDTAPPTTQPPGSQPGFTPDRRGMRPGPRPEGFQRLRTPGRPGPALTPEQRAAMQQFARENMPNLWASLQASIADEPLDPGGFHPRTGRLMGFARMRFLQHERIRREQPELEEVHLKQIRTLDEAFGLVEAWRRAPDGPEKEAARQKLREKFSEVVEIMIEEREQRLARLKDAVRREEERLASDKENRQRMIEQRLERFMSETAPPDPSAGDGPPPRDYLPAETPPPGPPPPGPR